MKKLRNAAIFLTALAVLFSGVALMPYAAEGDGTAETEAGSGAGAATGDGAVASGDAATRAAPRKSLADAVSAAEKMYYCGELYLFADSMVKANYEKAAIAANIKDAASDGSLSKSAALLDALTVRYNASGSAYNSWADVKGDLEYYIATVGTRTAFSKANLQNAFKRTLTVIDAARALLDEARAYRDDPSPAAKRAVTSSAEVVILQAAEAAAAIEPSAQKALASYRRLFDAFAQAAGIELEYRTVEDPASAPASAPAPATATTSAPAAATAPASAAA
ncbi:MAG: hypothetical protein LBU58_04965 [Clostridiales bacterium]|jgi:hypothetical protein|nr:hypothetical protein [Clostridiales bacterium]